MSCVSTANEWKKAVLIYNLLFYISVNSTFYNVYLLYVFYLCRIRFLSDTSMVEKIRSTFAGLYSLERVFYVIQNY